jgi:hypothetical protein
MTALISPIRRPQPQIRLTGASLESDRTTLNPFPLEPHILELHTTFNFHFEVIHGCGASTFVKEEQGLLMRTV